MKNKLTDLQVKHVKADPEKRIEIPDGGGLYLVVQPTGAKSWAFRYMWHGQSRKLTLKADLSLKLARAEADAKTELLKAGKDPAVAQAEEQHAEQPDLAKPMADLWLKRKVKGTASHDEVKRILDKEVMPHLKHRLVTDIKKPDILRVVDTLVDRDVPILANRTLSIMKRWFGWMFERGYIDANPALGLKNPSKEVSRDRVLTEAELTEIWNAAPDLGFPFGDWFRFLILTGQRRGEVTTMQWEHVDLDNALWTLPKEHTKARRIHDVPLSAQAKAILQKAPRFKQGTHIFTTTSGKIPVSGFSKAKDAIDKAILERRKKAAEKAGLDTSKVEPPAPWTIHDLRRTVATWCADHEVPPHVIGAILNHSPGSTMGITAVYARSRYSKEKRDALTKWADYVTGLTEQKDTRKRRTA